MKPNQFSVPKIFCHADKIARYQAKETPFPVSVDLSPSNCCNHNCIWCVYSKFLKQSREVLEKDVLLGLIDELNMIGVRGINFTGGGEPLTNPTTPEAMEKAHGLGIDIGLITNGGLLNEAIIKRLKPICKYIRVSLDAGTAKTHSRLHRVSEDEFDKILANIRILAKTVCRGNCQVGVQLLLVMENTNEIPSIIEKLKTLAVDFVEIRPAEDINKTINEARNLSDEYFDALEKMGEEKFKVIVRRDRFNLSFGYGKSYGKCFSPHFLATLGADGKVYTCCEFLGYKDYVLGDFKKEKLEDIFRFDRVEKELLKLNLDRCPGFCKTEMINRTLNSLENAVHPNIL